MDLISALLLSVFFDTQQFRGDLTPYERVVQVLQKIEAESPNTSKVIQVGVSDSGMPIMGIQIGQSGKANLIVGTHHGNEYGSTAVAMAAAQAFAQSPLQGQIIFVIPVLNISGYNSGSRFERNQRGQSIDPNRDYEGPCKTSEPFQLKSTASLAKFIDQAKIVTSATLHTHKPGVFYPLGLSTNDLITKDQDEYVRLAKLTAGQSGYAVGNSTELLYPADGTYEDYAYLKFGIWSLLFELGTTHSPNQNQINTMIQHMLPGIRRYFLTSPNYRSNQFAFSGRCDRSFPRRDKME